MEHQTEGHIPSLAGSRGRSARPIQSDWDVSIALLRQAVVAGHMVFPVSWGRKGKVRESDNGRQVHESGGWGGAEALHVLKLHRKVVELLSRGGKRRESYGISSQLG